MRHVRAYALLAASFLLVLAGTILQVRDELNFYNVTALPFELKMPTQAKFQLSLFVTLASLSLLLTAASLILHFRSMVTASWVTALVGGTASLASSIVPYFIGPVLNLMSLVGLLSSGILLLGYSLYLSRRYPLRLPRPTALQASSIALFSALTAVVTAYTGSLLPSPTGGYTHIGDSIVFVAALLFGCEVGTLTGILGMVAADLVLGYPRWYVTIIAHGLEGYLAGLGRGRGAVARFLACSVGGIAMAMSYFSVNVLIKGYWPALLSLARDIFGQALVSAIIATAVTGAVERAIKVKRMEAH